MKEFFKEEFKIGGDGGKGTAQVVADAGDIKVKFEAAFPVLKFVEPLRAKLKELVPGEKFDGLVDVAIDAGLKALGISAAKIEAAKVEA